MNTGRPVALESVPEEHVQAVDVDAVVGMPVRDHDTVEILDRDVLLQVGERAVPAVDPQRGAAGAHEVPAACTARGRTVRA